MLWLWLSVVYSKRKTVWLVCFATGNEQGWGDGSGARTLAVWVWGPELGYSDPLKAGCSGSCAAHGETWGRLWKLVGQTSWWTEHFTHKRLSQTRWKSRSPGPPDHQAFVMARACPHTHEHRHTDIRQTKNLCESLKKKTPVQLIFSQNTALLNHTPFNFLRFSSFSFIFLLSLKRHQNKRNRLNWRNLFTFPLST